MVAHIIQFPALEPPNEGNGALEIVRYFFDNVYPACVMWRLHSTAQQNAEAMHDGDHFLAYMGAAGFKIVPLEESDHDNAG
jgi:hypothetical protein